MLISFCSFFWIVPVNADNNVIRAKAFLINLSPTKKKWNEQCDLKYINNETLIQSDISDNKLDDDAPAYISNSITNLTHHPLPLATREVFGY